jgi:hypothetical protein
VALDKCYVSSMARMPANEKLLLAPSQTFRTNIPVYEMNKETLLALLYCLIIYIKEFYS